MPSAPQIPLSSEELGKWRRRVEQARAKRKFFEKWWDAALKDYGPDPAENPTDYAKQINTNRSYALVEQKKPQLYFQTPEVYAKPTPLMAGWEDAIRAHQDVLNEKLGSDGVNIKRIVQTVLFDVLCTAGMGAVKVGYQTYTLPVPDEEPDPDQPEQMRIVRDDKGQMVPKVDPDTGEPLEVPIHEECFVERVTPKKLLIPADFHSTDYKKAPWLGHEFVMPLAVAKRRYRLPEDFTGTCRRDEHVFEYGKRADDGDELVSGVELEYRAHLYDEREYHPHKIRLLVLIDGLDDDDGPGLHQDSPHQTFTPEGKLTPNSLKDFSLRPYTLRDVSDSAYVMSDVAVTLPQTKELNKFRHQQLRARDANIPIRVYNTAKVDPAALMKVETAEWGELVGLPDEAFHGPQLPIVEIARASYPRENMAFEEKQDADITRTHALGAAQQALQDPTGKTATESTFMQRSADVRLDAERGINTDWFCDVVTAYSTLEQRYLTVEKVAEIVGPQKAQRWAQWVQAVPSALAFTVKPDSMKRVDAGQEKKDITDWLNWSGSSPYINQQQNWMEAARRYGFDPGKLVTQPPESKPDPAKGSISLKPEDFVGPQAPAAQIMARAIGIEIPDHALASMSLFGQLWADMQAKLAAQQQAQPGQTPENPTQDGTLEKMSPLDKHTSALTGGMQGMGSLPS